MTNQNLLLTQGFTSPLWELPCSSTAILLGWKSPDADEEQLPTQITALLAETMISSNTALFLSDAIDSEFEEIALSSNLLDKLNFSSRKPRLVASTNPKMIANELRVGRYDWHQHAQIVMSCNMKPEKFTLKTLLDVIGTKNISNMEQIWRYGIEAALLPGVDGDVAGLYARDKGQLISIMKCLKHLAAVASLDLHILDEATFGNQLATLG